MHKIISRNFHILEAIEMQGDLDKVTLIIDFDLLCPNPKNQVVKMKWEFRSPNNIINKIDVTDMYQTLCPENENILSYQVVWNICTHKRLC